MRDPIESPFAPNLTQVVDALMTKLEGGNTFADKLTPSQDVLSTTISTTQSAAKTMQQAAEYIKRTKQVINALHEQIDIHKQRNIEMRNLLKHCLAQIENPRPRNQDLIVNAIKQLLEDK